MADYTIIQEALNRGYTIDEIADKLSTTSGFDPTVIRERGYGATDILAKLGYEPPAPEPQEESPRNLLGATADVGRLLYDVPTQAMAAIGNLAEDDDPSATQDWRDRWRESGAQRTEERRRELGVAAQERTFLPGVTRGDIAEASGSTGFSLVSMGAGLLGGAAAAPIPVPGTTAAGFLGASGAAAYKMDKTMFTAQLIDAANNALIEERGSAMTPEERSALLERTADARNRHALWEAGPEAVGNLLTATGVGSIFAGVGKKAIGKIVGGLTKMYGGELSTETVTQTGQQRAEVDAGLSKEAPREWASAGDWGQSFKEIYPTTMVLSTLTGGGGAIAGKVADVVASKPQPTAPSAIASKVMNAGQTGDPSRDVDAAIAAMGEIVGEDIPDTAISGVDDIIPTTQPIQEAPNGASDVNVPAGMDRIATEGGGLISAGGGSNGLLQPGTITGAGGIGMPGAPVAPDAESGTSPGGVRADELAPSQQPAASTPEVSAKADEIMRLMGGHTAITRDQVVSLIEEKGMDAAEKTVRALKDSIKQREKTAAYRNKAATPQPETKLGEKIPLNQQPATPLPERGTPGAVIPTAVQPVAQQADEKLTVNQPVKSAENPNRAVFSPSENGRTISVAARGVQPAIFGAKFENEARAYYEGLKAAQDPQAFVNEWRANVQENTKRAIEHQYTPAAAPVADLFNQPAQTAAHPAEEADFEHSGYAIRKVNIKRDDKVKQYWSVQTEDNRQLAAEGKREIGGDTLHETKEAAIKEAERQVKFVEQDRARNERIAAEEADSLAKGQARKSKNQGLSISERKANAVLDKDVNIEGKLMSLREAVGMIVNRGGELKTEEVPRIQPMSRKAYFRADNREQEAHEKRMKEAGNKTLYYVGGYDLGKTAFDYALSLKNNEESDVAETEFGNIDQEQQATAILDRANVTGKDRLDIMAAFLEGKKGYSLADLEKAYPVAGEQQPTPDQAAQVDQPRDAISKLANSEWEKIDAFDAIQSLQKDEGKGFYSNDVGLKIIKAAAKQFEDGGAMMRRINKFVAKRGDTTFILPGFNDAVAEEFLWKRDYLAQAVVEYAKNAQAEQPAKRDSHEIALENGARDKIAEIRKAAREIDNEQAAKMLNEDADRREAQFVEQYGKGSQEQTAEDKPQGKIEDFGEHIPGSRKDKAAAMREAVSRELSDDDIASMPLSKIWPKESIDQIEDTFAAAVAHAARAEVPAKPKVGYKLKAWVEKVKTVRSLASMMLDGKVTKEHFTEALKEHRGLEHFAEKVELLEQIDRASWDRIGRVEANPNSYRYNDAGEKVAAPIVRVEIDGRSNYFPVSTVANAVADVQAKLGIEVAAKKMEFEVRGREGSYFINKKGDPLYRKLKTFTTSKEALDYRKSNYSDLVAAWEAVKESDNVKEEDVRGKENRPRSSEDWRKGKDITPEQFSSDLGFKRGQFGEWVSQGKSIKERQGMLNEAYDAFMDLASIIGVPPKALSLNGSLGIAFGARGAGWASAHYEPDMLVINLTKTRGAGTLAHEWFHAMDNYFQRERIAKGEKSRRLEGGHSGDFITYAPENYYVNKRTGNRMAARDYNAATDHTITANYNGTDAERRAAYARRMIGDPTQWEKMEGVRPEVGEAFADLVKALNDSPMAKRASLIDKGKSGGYWSRIIERGARSFENYVIHKMMLKGYHNDYLANVVPAELFQRDEGRYPYLLEGEIQPVAEAFDNLFATIQTKETDKGVALFSQSTTPARNPFTLSGLKAAINSAFSHVKDFAGLLEGTGKVHFISKAQIGEHLGGGAAFSKAQDQTDTPAFKAWFGNSAVVDVDGKPLILYHGGTRFDAFRKDTDSLAHYATDSMDVAQGYASQYEIAKAEIKPLYLRMENPLDLRTPEAFEEWTGITPMPGFSEYGILASMAHNNTQIRSGGKLLEKAKSAGYDGIIFHDTDVMNRGVHTSYAFFDQTQAKLAPDTETKGGTWWDYPVRQGGNIGTFEGADIRYSADGSRILAFVKDGQTYFVYDNISSTDDSVKGLMLHEISAHALALGRSEPEFQAILKQFTLMGKMGNEKVKAAQDRVPADTPAHLVEEESLGYYLEANPDLKFSQKVIAWFRAQLRKMGKSLPAMQRMQWFSAIDNLAVEDIVYAAHQALKTAPQTLATARDRGTFLAGASDKLYSQLRVAIRDMNDKIFQGSAANVKLHLMNNLGKYKIKSDEIFWTGLTEFLSGTNKVSKADVLAFLDENAVVTKDVVLGAGGEKLLTASDVEITEDGDEFWEAWVPGQSRTIGKKHYPTKEGARDFALRYFNGHIEERNREKNNTKFPTQVLPGGRDYRELLITLPTSKSANRSSPEMQKAAAEYYGEKFVDSLSDAQWELVARKAQGTLGKEFTSSHYPDVKNLIAHVRLDTRDDAQGRVGTFAEEFQSDASIEASKRGFKTDLRAVQDGIGGWKVVDKNGDDVLNGFGVVISADTKDAAIAQVKEGAVPPMPFVTSSTGKGSTAHTLLSLKKTILYAIEQGHEFVSWTTGAQQKDRYSLSKQIDSVSWTDYPSAGKDHGVLVATKDGEEVIKKTIPRSELGDHIGKAVADKLLAQENDIGGRKTLEGVSMDIGGEWADALYGNENGLDANGKPSLMTQAVKEVARQLGIELKVGVVELTDISDAYTVKLVAPDNYALKRGSITIEDGFGTPEEARGRLMEIGEEEGGKMSAQPGFPITPALRSKVTSAGMPLFSKQQTIPGTAQPPAQPPRQGKMPLQGGQPKTRIIGDSSRQYTPEQRAAMARTGSVVTQKSTQETLQTLWQGAGKKLAQGIVDQFRPIRDLDDHAYTLMRLSKGATGAFEAFMHHGKLSIKDGAFDADTSGGVLEKVFFQLGKESTDFLRWVAGNRAERLKAAGLERLFTDEDIAAFKSLADGKTNFDYTMLDGTATRDRTLIYRDSLKKFNEFNKNVLDMAEQSGLIDGASRKLWEHEFYVPFYRTAAEEDGGVRGMNIKSGVIRQQAFHKLKGGEQQLNDLLENTLMNWAHMIDASAKNRAAMATLKAAEKVGAARKALPGEKKTVWFMENGQKAEYKVEDPYLMEAISSLEYAGLRGGAMNAMSTVKHWLTVGVTASPFFKIRNLIRDSVQAIGTASNSDLSYNPLANVKKGFKLTDRKNAAQEYVSALAGGGLIRFGTMLEGSEAKRTRQLIKQGAKDSHILDNESKVRALYDKYLEPSLAYYNELGNRGEEINRMALYDTLIKQGMGHATASLMARDLMDFSMQGTWTSVRFLTQIVPFMNARLQGLYKLGRATQDDKARFAIVLGATAMASLALLAAYGDDDDWKKREDWDRDNYWWFKIGGEAFRIPKPFEIGAIATLAERSAELVFDKEMTGKRFASLTLALAGNQLAMNPIPQLFKPIVDLYANKDSFTGRDIESMGMERLAPDYRFKQSTSMVARGISTAGNTLTGDHFLSPVQIDHINRAYFGWLGSFIVGGADYVVRGASNEPTKPALDYWKVATGGMVSSLDGAHSRYVSQMYDQARELEEAYGTWRNLLKEGKTEEAKEYREDNKDKLARYRRVENIKKQASKINERIRDVERGNLDSNEKQRRINNLRQQQDVIARRLVSP